MKISVSHCVRVANENSVWHEDDYSPRFVYHSLQIIDDDRLFLNLADIRVVGSGRFAAVLKRMETNGTKDEKEPCGSITGGHSFICAEYLSLNGKDHTVLRSRFKMPHLSLER